MKAIVFGGSGFVGSHVADALLTAGHEVTIFDLRPSRYLQDKQKFIQGDILDYEAVQKAVAGQQVLYNFAGLADFNEAAARSAQVKRFVFASSIYVYSESGGFYRASKQACELYVEEFQRRYSLDYT